jgi:Sulfotransferase family
MIVFLHISKTAGSTFQFILENTFGLSACHADHSRKKVFRRDDFDFACKFFPRMQSLAGHGLADPLSLDAPKPFHITFLREPIARVFSHYQDTVLGGGNTIGFEEYLRQGRSLANLHVKLMAGGLDLDKAKRYLELCGFVGITEKFDLSLHVLKNLSPVPLNLNYKRRRIAPTDRIKKSLADDPRMVGLAREYNQLDIALYDFALNEIFPKFCEQAGFKPSDTVESYNNYTSDFKWRYRLCHLYNQLIYRQACKLRL